MHSAVEIANKYIQLAEKEDSLFSHMKLQKLIYIANGIYLATNNEPLISERIEVWPYGPVVADVYRTYKAFGNSNICLDAFGIYPLDVQLTENENKAFIDAWKIAKEVDAVQLSNWTHNQDSPWTKAKAENLTVIPDDYMKDYFKKFLVNE